MAGYLGITVDVPLVEIALEQIVAAAKEVLDLELEHNLTAATDLTATNCPELALSLSARHQGRINSFDLQRLAQRLDELFPSRAWNTIVLAVPYGDNNVGTVLKQAAVSLCVAQIFWNFRQQLVADGKLNVTQPQLI